MITQINTPTSSEMMRNREAVQRELTTGLYDPEEMSFEKYRKGFLEKKELKLAKKEHSKLAGTPKYIEKRNDIANQILTSKTPKWGGVKVLLID